MFSGLSEFQTVKRFINCDSLDNFSLCDVEDVDFVGRITGVQYHGKFALGMNGDIDWEISELDLFSSGSKRPKVGEQYGTVRLLAWPAHWSLRALFWSRCRRCVLRGSVER